MKLPKEGATKKIKGAKKEEGMERPSDTQFFPKFVSNLVPKLVNLVDVMTSLYLGP